MKHEVSRVQREAWISYTVVSVKSHSFNSSWSDWRFITIDEAMNPALSSIFNKMEAAHVDKTQDGIYDGTGVNLSGVEISPRTPDAVKT